MSRAAVGTWVTATTALSVCLAPPKEKSAVETSSVRACCELGVVAPVAGAQKSRLPSAPRVSHGGVIAAVPNCLALPLKPPEESTGRVSFQPLSETGPVAAGEVAAAVALAASEAVAVVAEVAVAA